MSLARFLVSDAAMLNLNNQQITSSSPGSLLVDNVAVGSFYVVSINSSPYTVTPDQSGTTFIIKIGVNVILPAPTTSTLNYYFIFGPGNSDSFFYSQSSS
jgi:hypothetical protein